MNYFTNKFSPIILFFLAILFLESCYPQEKQKITKKNHSEVKISFAGDLMCHSAIIEAARVQADSFDFNPFYKFIRNELLSADLLVGNLETVVWEKYPPAGYPRFNAPIEYLNALANSGFDILATANNHITDYWKDGLQNTLTNISKAGMDYIGCSKSQKDADSLRIFHKNGISISVLNYTYDINIKNLKKNEKYFVNFIDTVRIKNDISNLKSKNVDLIIVFYHFGDEYKTLPNNYQKFMVEKTFSFGADIIVGSHPHVLQPVATIKDDKNKKIKKAVCYSLGNFISNMKLRYTDGSAILNFYIRKDVDGVVIDSITFLPVWVYKGGKGKFYILPSGNDNYAFLDAENLAKMKNSYQDVVGIINKFEYVSEKKIK